MKHVFRALLKSPGYTLLAVGALALGLGANTVLFSAINTLFLRPLAFPQPEQLIKIYTVYSDPGLGQVPASWPRFTAYRDQQDAFAGVTAQAFTQFVLTGRGDPEQVPGRRVTADFFSVLGVQPSAGRSFAAAEDAAGGPDVVLLSQAFWKKHFAGKLTALGQTLTLDGRPHTVIGILPPLPSPFDQAQVWAPRPFELEGLPADLRDKGTGYLDLFARLKPGITLAQAQEKLHVITARYLRAEPARVDAKTGEKVVPLHEDLVGNQRPMFLTLLAAVGCVLLVACANVANLLLARFAGRRKETAIRAALGATRGRIVRQFLAESVLTSAIAGIFGMLLAAWGTDVLARVAKDFLPRTSELSLDGRVLGFGCALTLLTGLLLGLVPAWQASRAEAGETLKDAARGSTGGRRAGNFRAGLLVIEVALSFVLLVGAALLIDSFRRLQHTPTGFRTEGVTVFPVALPPGQYPTLERQAQFFQQVLEKIRALPGVTQVAASSGIPAGVNGGARAPIAAEGNGLPPLHERRTVRRSTCTPGFFASLDVPIVKGRDFTWRDRDGAPNVVMINTLLAERLFPGQDPIGRRVITGILSIPREVVGVFAPIRSDNLAQPPPEEMCYPSMQVDGEFQNVVVRSMRPASSLRGEIAQAVHAVDPGLPVGDVDPYSKLLAGAVADRRLAMLLLGSFAGLALVLAGMGIYSVIAYSVAQRTNEFGIRLALGATPTQVVTMVLREGMRLAATGLIIGVAVAFAVTHLMQKMLFEVSASDPLIFAGVAAFLGTIAVFACLLPALRATSVDPMAALRAE